MATKSGLGSYRKLPSGNWQLRYTAPDGVRRTARSTFKTKALAELELLRIRNEIESGTWRVDHTPQANGVDPKSLTLRELAQIWRDQRVTVKGKPLSPNTLDGYQKYVEVTLKPFTDKKIREITTQQIETWRAPEFKRAPNQTVKAYKHLLQLMTWAQRRAWIASNPCTIERGTAYTPSEPPIPKREQAQIMLDVAPGAYKALLAFSIYGGLRKGEILELRKKDIEIIDNGSETWVIAHVSRAVIWDKTKAIVTTPKTAAGVRSVQLHLDATPIIVEHLRNVAIHPDAMLFPKAPGVEEHWSEHQMNPTWKKIRAQAGFPYRFHSTRSFHLTYFGITGASIAELMDRGGHRDIKTAMRYQRVTGRESELLRKMS